MKYYSEKLNQLFDSETQLKRAEKKCASSLGKHYDEVLYSDFVIAKENYQKVREEYDATIKMIEELYTNIDAEIDIIMGEILKTLEEAEKEYKEATHKFFG